MSKSRKARRLNRLKKRLPKNIFKSEKDKIKPKKKEK